MPIFTHIFDDQLPTMAYDLTLFFINGLTAYIQTIVVEIMNRLAAAVNGRIPSHLCLELGVGHQARGRHKQDK
jgi:hypothetical protein